jgi:hypothetical protein
MATLDEDPLLQVLSEKPDLLTALGALGAMAG